MVGTLESVQYLIETWTKRIFNPDFLIDEVSHYTYQFIESIYFIKIHMSTQFYPSEMTEIYDYS